MHYIPQEWHGLGNNYRKRLCRLCRQEVEVSGCLLVGCGCGFYFTFRGQLSVQFHFCGSKALLKRKGMQSSLNG